MQTPPPPPPAVPPLPAPPAPSPFPRGRLVSLDALRGFTMMWIVGATTLAKTLLMLCDTPATRALAGQFEHVQWAGFHFFDLILPLFIFMVGVSVP